MYVNFLFLIFNFVRMFSYSVQSVRLNGGLKCKLRKSRLQPAFICKWLLHPERHVNIRINIRTTKQTGTLGPFNSYPYIYIMYTSQTNLKRWYINDKLHRTDGPACDYTDGTKCWYLNDIELSQEEYLRTTRKNKLKLLGL